MPWTKDKWKLLEWLLRQPSHTIFKLTWSPSLMGSPPSPTPGRVSHIRNLMGGEAVPPPSGTNSGGGSQILASGGGEWGGSGFGCGGGAQKVKNFRTSCEKSQNFFALRAKTRKYFENFPRFARILGPTWGGSPLPPPPHRGKPWGWGEGWRNY